MNNQKIVNFLQQNSAINLTNLEKEAGIPSGVLGKVMRGERSLNDNHIKLLLPVLMRYGFRENQRQNQARIISVVNHKGGVGKTTTTLNLGKSLARSGQKVLLIDMDAQANLSQSLKVEQPESSIYNVISEGSKTPIHQVDENFYLIPSDLDLSKAEMELQSAVNGYFRLRKSLKEIDHDYDFILIDCPPSLGVLTINALMAATDVLICVQSEYLALKGLNTILELIDNIREDLHPDLNIMGMLLTMTNRTIIKKSIVENIQQAYQDKVFDTTIRQNISVVEASASGMDLFSYDENCAAAKDYEKLAGEVLAR